MANQQQRMHWPIPESLNYGAFYDSQWGKVPLQSVPVNQAHSRDVNKKVKQTSLDYGGFYNMHMANGVVDRREKSKMYEETLKEMESGAIKRPNYYNTSEYRSNFYKNRQQNPLLQQNGRLPPIGGKAGQPNQQMSLQQAPPLPPANGSDVAFPGITQVDMKFRFSDNSEMELQAYPKIGAGRQLNGP